VFELTRHYELTLPLMLCSMTASIVSRLIDSDSYYNESLRAKGQEIPTGIEETAMRRVYVRDVMRRDFATVRDTDSFERVMEVLGSHPGDTIYVLDQHNGLGGAIQLQDVKNFINDPTLSSVVIAHDLTRPAISVAVHESLAQVMVRFEDPEINELAVTTSDQPPRLLGRVTRRDLLTGISDEVLGTTRRARLRTHDQRQSSLLELPPGWELAEVPVPEEWAGLAVDAIPEADLEGILPVLVVTRRAGTVRLPATPEQVLEVGARLLVIARSDALRKLQDRTASS
jgi:predicted transcriptional regulator